MPKYFIEINHNDDTNSCVKALHAVEKWGSHFITHANWGCVDGHHFGWMIAEVDDKESAKQLVPFEFRQTARVVETCHFTKEQIQGLVDEHGVDVG